VSHEVLVCPSIVATYTAREADRTVVFSHIKAAYMATFRTTYAFINGSVTNLTSLHP
jgi:hypothetical protein